MEDPIIQIKNLFNTVISGEWEAIHKIPQSGGDRIYFRIHQGGQSWIATVSLNIKESFLILMDLDNLAIQCMNHSIFHSYQNTLIEMYYQDNQIP